MAYKDGISGVYIIKNKLNGNYYIGSTSNNRYRWYNHRRKLNNNTHDNVRLQRAWNKYGAENFEFKMFIVAAPTDSLLFEEKLLNKHFGKKYCYNLSKSAIMPGLGRRWTDEQRKQASITQKKLFTPERRLELSLINLGRKFSTESKLKMRSAAIKRFSNITEEMDKDRRDKISKSSSSRIRTKFEKIKISEGKLNSKYSHSLDVRLKISNSVKRADCKKYKFSTELIDDAISQYKSGKYSQRYIADKYGISRSYFGKILKNRS